MRRVALMIVVAATAIAGVVQATASPVPPSDGTGRAVVLVDTPGLPAGDGPAAEARWHELRSRSREVLERIADRNGLAVETAIPEVGQLSVDLGPGGLPALRRELADDPRVESVRPDVPVELRYAPNDFAFTHPDVHAPSGDLGDWNAVKEGGPRAWDLSKGSGAEVAMVDTGVDGAHPDLAQRIAGSASFGISSPLTDPVGHGTHTAGLACGHSDNGYGIASLGFACALFIAKIENGGPCSNVTQAVVAAANRRSSVINMSIGGCDSAIVSALDYAQSRGSVIVAAADNTPNPTGECPGLIFQSFDCLYPEEWAQPNGTGPNASFNRGLVVTSARYDGARSGFAEATTRVSLAAYGSATDSVGGQQGILSTWPAATVEDDAGGGRTSLNGDSRFAYLQGTSMATPQVAAVAALIRAVKPSLANTKVVQLIKATASHCGTYGSGVGWGIVRADEAVAAALNKDIDPPASNVRSAKKIRRRGASASRSRGKLIRIRLKRQDASGAHCVKGLPVSGVKKVVVFASANGGAYHRIRKTTKKVVTFRGKRRRHYGFYSVAVDNDGNREAPPPIPDAQLR